MAPSRAWVALRLAFVLLLAMAGAAAQAAAAAAAAAAAGGCLPVSVSIKAPDRVAQARSFRAKVTVANNGAASLQSVLVEVQLPVQATVLKVAPAGVLPAPGSPWILRLATPALAPGKSQTIAIEAVVGKGFQGSFPIAVTVTLPSVPTCPPVQASRTIAIKTPRKLTWNSAAFYVNPAEVLVECGQPLPFLPPEFPMGQCGDRTTADARVWGPEAWQTLHVMAQNYPTNPSSQAITGCTNFVNALPFMLPSPMAGYTFGQFIQANNENAGTFSPACQASAAYGMPCTTPAQACANQTALVSFFLRAHHAVDVLTKPCKPLWTVQQATRAYAYQPDFCATCIVWGTLPICKEVGETGCASVNTTVPCGQVAPPSPSPGPATSSPTQAPTASQQLTVECGVVLQPSISNWAMGQCGNRTTADPRVFGPYTWRTLHRFMQHYPVTPSAQTREACANFVNGLPFLIPCPHCGYDFSQFIVANVQNAGTFSAACVANATYNMPCTTVETACSTRGLLIDFFLRAHHNVDTHNKPCKPQWSRQQAADAYLVQTNFCATGITNGRHALCRSTAGSGGSDEQGCVTLTTSPPCGAWP